jgi:EAL domain-containing protein (putative c-di-GMP-specific phosphodiesterase class I)
VAGIISLADALAITVTAEGVERSEQAAMLRSLSCPGAQGFLYSAAVPPDLVPALLVQRFEPA